MGGRLPALVLAVVGILAVEWLLVRGGGEPGAGALPDGETAGDATGRDAPHLALRERSQETAALSVAETVDPAWLLGELRRPADARRVAAYERASRCERLAHHDDLASLLLDWFLSDDRVLSQYGNVLLHRMGGAVTSLLAPYAASADPVARRKVLTLLITLDGEARTWTLARLLDLVQDRDADVAHLALSITAAGVPYDEALARHLLGRIRSSGDVAHAGPEVALARMGRRGMDLLLGLLDAPGDDLALNVLGGLRGARPDDLRPLLPRVAAEILASGEDEDRRVAAIRVLDAMQGDCEACLPALATALGDESILVLRAALSVLEAMGARAAPALDPLLARLAEGDERVAPRVAALLGRMPAEAERVVPALAAALGGDAGEAAALALGAFGARALPYALAALDGDDEAARYAALLTLGRVGAPAARATSRLVALMRSEDPALALRACDVAGQIGPGAAAAVPIVLERLVAGDLQGSGRASTILLGLGAAAQEPLRTLLRHEDAVRRQRAAVTLAAMWGRTAFALADLEALLADGERDTRFAALEAADAALWLPGRPYAYEEADPALRERVRAVFRRALASPHADVTAYARDALARLDAATATPSR